MGTPMRGLPWRSGFFNTSPPLSPETSCRIHALCPTSSSRAPFRLMQRAEDAPDPIHHCCCVVASCAGCMLVGAASCLCIGCVCLPDNCQQKRHVKQAYCSCCSLHRTEFLLQQCTNKKCIPFYICILAHSACGLLPELFCMHPSCIHEVCIPGCL